MTTVYRVNTSISKEPLETNVHASDSDDGTGETDSISGTSRPNSDISLSSFGSLFIVSTPIGNLADISGRALDVLAKVDCILAEDTRHSKRLLNHYGISTSLRSCHEHNEASMVDWVVKQINDGKNLALISDAGTPLISDPGFVLVRSLRQLDHQVVAVPGASSIIAALSIAGLPTDSFIFDGFLSSKSSARQTQYAKYRQQTRTVVLLESSHRIVASIDDLISQLGGDRFIVIARELTKRFETVLSGSAQKIADMLKDDEDQTRGEFVLMIAGVPKQADTDVELEQMLRVLLAEVSVKQATKIAVKMTGQRKNDVYQLALKLKSKMPA